GTAFVSVTISSERIAEQFARLRASGRRALVPYVTAGHPSPDETLALLSGLEDAGADVIEVGVPFSDPMADGPIIQASSQQALAAGMTFDGVLDTVSRPEQARAVAALADGVVVGSAIVRAAGESVESAVTLAASLRAAIDTVSP